MITNPKLRALQDSEVAPQPQGDEQDKFAAEQQLMALEREINALPNSPAKDKLLGDLKMAQSMGSKDLTSILLETNAAQSNQNAEEGQKIQQSMGGSLTAVAGMGSLAHFAHLDGKLGNTGEILLKNHTGIDLTDPSKITVESSNPVHHFNPGVINPGIQIAIMRSIDKGQGIGLNTGDR